MMEGRGKGESWDAESRELMEWGKEVKPPERESERLRRTGCRPIKLKLHG